MITTVGKAKEKWCPFDRGQSSPREATQGMCLGLECMMWVYYVTPEELMENKCHGIKDCDKKGYCGLAGRA